MAGKTGFLIGATVIYKAVIRLHFLFLDIIFL
jgi:hypothetical protein